MYSVTFDSPLVPVATQTRTVDQTTPLHDLEWDGYIFMGWSNDRGKIITSVEPGTTDITLHANWTSQRNQTRPNDYLSKAPIIIDDEQSGNYLFIYDIGTIINVPLYTIKDFGNKTGITISETYTTTGSTTEAEAKQINEAISNATTKSSSWTLSKNWNETITETTGGSETITNESVLAVSSGSSNTEGDSQMDKDGFSSEVARKDGTTSKTIESNELGFDVGGSIETSAGTKNNYVKGQLNASISGSMSRTDESGTSSELSHSGSAFWNTDTGYTHSNTTTSNKSLTDSVAKSISSNWGYSISRSVGGSESQTESSSATVAASKGYSSAISYTTQTTETTVSTWSNADAEPGYYRLVCAGKAHVFGVVGYNVSSRSFFVYTYSVMDDETYSFYDYSKNDPEFKDYENGVLPFEIPIFVSEYIGNAVCATDGLIIDRSTGIITDYEGEDKAVFVPDYMVLDNGDGSNNVVKVKGIDKDAFRGNKNITAVKLGSYITEIPDKAFSGCKSLEYLEYNSLNKIGSSAFSGCEKLSGFTVNEEVTELGDGAFDGAVNVTVNASNAAVAKAAVTCGAKNVLLNLSKMTDELSGKLVSNATESFEINGGRKTFKRLSIESNAASTSIDMMTLEDNSGIPFKFGSPSVVLNQVSVIDASGVAAALTADSTELSLRGMNNLSTKGSNAMLSRSITLKRVKGVAETTKLNTTGGDVLVCGTVDGDKYLNVSGGEVKYITDEEFERLLKINVISLDANGGSVSVDEVLVNNGQAVGKLPEAVREGYDFDGWYTLGGEKVTESTVIESDITLTAKWSAKQFTVSWNNSAGCIISVSRTSSPIAGASLGALSNGSAVYYGDTLAVAYSAASGYQLSDYGLTAFAVSGNITSADIYASAVLIGKYVATVNYDDGSYVCKMEIRNVNGHPYFRGWMYNRNNLAEKCRIDVNSLDAFNATGASGDCQAGNGYGFDHISSSLTWSGTERVLIHAFGAAGSAFVIYDKFLSFN